MEILEFDGGMGREEYSSCNMKSFHRQTEKICRQERYFVSFFKFNFKARNSNFNRSQKQFLLFIFLTHQLSTPSPIWQGNNFLTLKRLLRWNDTLSYVTWWSKEEEQTQYRHSLNKDCNSGKSPTYIYTDKIPD